MPTLMPKVHGNTGKSCISGLITCCENADQFGVLLPPMPASVTVLGQALCSPLTQNREIDEQPDAWTKAQMEKATMPASLMEAVPSGADCFNDLPGRAARRGSHQTPEPMPVSLNRVTETAK